MRIYSSNSLQIILSPRLPVLASTNSFAGSAHRTSAWLFLLSVNDDKLPILSLELSEAFLSIFIKKETLSQYYYKQYVKF